MSTETVLIIGSGIVGKSWAMLFASAGHKVRLYDSFPEALAAAPKQISEKLKSLEATKQLRGKLTADQQIALLSYHNNLKEALQGVTYVQECTPERLDIKTGVFQELKKTLAEIGNTTAIIGSSTSTMMPSKFIGEGICKRSVVVHPVNPPYFVRLVEIVPTPTTEPSVTAHVRQLLTDLGQKPIVMNKELPGFALNRVQYAILNEMWRLVNGGYVTVEDADTVMTEGLAPRYCFIGPLETAQLNAEGFVDYCERYGEAIHDVSLTQTEIPRMTPEGSKEIDRQLQEKVKNGELPQRRQWRDENLAQLATFKKNLGIL
jgi:L-gulonate 3-dehydrogenase